jgi:ferrochelatase
MTADKPIGIVLLQLGGPDSLRNVEPFLYNLFCDPDIIDLPMAFLFRRALARFVSKRRAPKVQEFYKRIGGKSPILKLTMRQARALERELEGKLNAKIYVAMRYWHPLTDATFGVMSNDRVDQVILLPLYPQYSKTTTGSSVNEWNRAVARYGKNGIRVKVVDQYCEHPLYVQAVVRNVRRALNRVPPGDRGKVHLVFSAHGVPVKVIKSGDPYEEQIRKTVSAVMAAGEFGLPHYLCFQSKVGPERWLTPSLTDTIERLAHMKASHVLVVPIAFVCDHSETLWEINIEMKQEAKHLGIKYFDMSPALNTNPLFIRALADIVLKAVAP